MTFMRSYMTLFAPDFIFACSRILYSVGYDIYISFSNDIILFYLEIFIHLFLCSFILMEIYSYIHLFKEIHTLRIII